MFIAAGLLHNIGIHQAKKKYGSPAGKFQEIEEPRYKISEICEIIAHHHSPGKIKSLNFKILYDADWLVNLKKDEYDIRDKNKLNNIISLVFMTRTSQALVREIYLDNRQTSPAETFILKSRPYFPLNTGFLFSKKALTPSA